MERYPQMDALRVAACVSVMLIHVTAGISGRVPLALNQLARFSVPVFLMISGFGHAGARTSSVRQRLGRILPPYLLWSLIYLGLDAVFGKPHLRPFLDLLCGTAYMHLYYCFVLVQFILLCPVLRRAMERRPKALLLLSALLSLGAQFAICLQMAGRIALPIPLVLTFLPWMIFYVLGLALRSRHPWGRAASLPVLFPLWLVSALGILWTAKQFPFLRGQTLRPGLTVYALISFLLLWTIFDRLPTLSRRLGCAAGLTFAIYLGHPLVMRLWNEWAMRQSPVVYLSLWQFFLLTLAGSCLIALALRKLPFGALLGAPKGK